jgi:hypothetical protein
MLTKHSPLIRSTSFSSACLHRDNHSLVAVDWPAKPIVTQIIGSSASLRCQICQIIAQEGPEERIGAMAVESPFCSLFRVCAEGEIWLAGEMRFCVIEFDSGRVARGQIAERWGRSVS